MQNLAELVASHEDWLMNCVLGYAKAHDYTQYTSTLAEAWRASIAGLSQALIHCLQVHDGPPELRPDEDFAEDPVAAFGILQAQRHRARGVPLSMFLGLLKYYRQSYVDLVLEAGFDRDTLERHRLYVNRFFDRVELGFTVEWAERPQEDLVDELRSANRLMTNEKNKYLTIFESVANPIILLNDRNEIENMNHAALTAFSDRETPGSYYYDGDNNTLPMDWLRHELDEFIVSGKTEMVFEKTFQSGRGGRRYEVRFTPMLDVSGKFSGSIVVFNDITEQRRAQDDLKVSEERLRLVFEESPIGIGVTLNGTVVYGNPAMAKTFGYESPAEIVGRPKEALVSPEDRPRLMKLRSDGLNGKVMPSSIELRGLRKTGESFDMEVWAKPIDHHGQPSLLIFAVDTSQAKMLWKQLLQAQKLEAVGTLAGGIAHDFNNLLAVIHGYAELILAEVPEGGTVYEDLQKIIQTAMNGSDLVRRLLVFTGRVDTNAVPMNLNARIEGLLELLQRTLPKMIGIELDLCSDVATITADSAQMDQLVMNLAINAADAMPKGGRLMMKTENVVLDEAYCRSHAGAALGPNVLLTVSDNGRGMSEDTLQRIFDPFFTTKRRDSRKGTGLGLSVVQGIVEQHGGHITCDSKPALGTTFGIYFPASESSKKGGKHVEQPLRSNEPTTILLVDDEEYVRDIGRRIFERAGFKVLTAANGKDALDLYRTEKTNISLVILDLIMPEMGGRQCLDELLKIDHSAKVVVATGFSPDAGTQEELAVAAKGVIRKPYNLKALMRTVREVLDSD